MIKVELKEKDFVALLEAVMYGAAFAKKMENEEKYIRYEDLHDFLRGRAEGQLGRALEK